jgi:hypothetical protein
MYVTPYQIARCRNIEDHNPSIGNADGCILAMNQRDELTNSLSRRNVNTPLKAARETYGDKEVQSGNSVAVSADISTEFVLNS